MEAKQDFRIIQIGCGSMGKRRIRNMQHWGQNQISCFDIRPDRVDEAAALYGVQKINSKEEINWDDYTHCIISTPPDQHHSYALESIGHGVHTFIEASVLDNGFDDIIEAHSRNSSAVLAPSCTMRFDPIIAKAKEIIDSSAIGKPRIVNHHFGQYLPYWHPYEDIRDYYVSKKETGAAREIVPFDLVYLSWLFGNPSLVHGFYHNSGDLGEDIEIDDIYSFTAVTKSNVMLNVTIDVISQVSYRDTRVIGSEGNLEIDNVSGTLKVYSGKEGTWKIYKRDELQSSRSTEDMYVQEMKCFIDATTGKNVFPYSLPEDKEILNMLYKVEESFQKSSTQKI